MLLLIIPGPGGINIFKPILESLTEEELSQILITPLHQFVEMELINKYNIIKPDAVMELLQEDILCIDNVIYDTSRTSNELDDILSLTKYKDIGIYLALDIWGNELHRLYGKKSLKDCKHIPDYIISPCEYATKRLLDIGIKEDHILKYGNPHFERKVVKREDIYNTLKDENKENIIFISQCFKEDGASKSQEEWFNSWYNNLEDLSKYNIVFRPHPREDYTWIAKYSNVIIYDDFSIDTTSLALCFDKVVGISSTVLYDLYLMNYRNIDILDNKFILDETMFPYRNSLNNYTKLIKNLL